MTLSRGSQLSLREAISAIGKTRELVLLSRQNEYSLRLFLIQLNPLDPFFAGIAKQDEIHRNLKRSISCSATWVIKRLKEARKADQG